MEKLTSKNVANTITRPIQTLLKPHHNQHVDVLIIGSGAAGLTLALRLPKRLSIAVVSKDRLAEGSTLYAQGGISAVLDDSDSVDAHVSDTLIAGAGLCHEDAVRQTVEHGPNVIRWLIDAGVPFTRTDSDDGYHLAREGGHSHRRIIHAADRTGRAVSTTLEALTRASDNIQLFEYCMAVEIITESNNTGKKAIGAYLLDRESGDIVGVRCKHLVLGCGGANKVYLYSSNPHASTGDGIAMAWRAGCRVANMEFMQFHPTCLYHPKKQSFLITEAIRGEGGRLLLPNGEPFMQDHDERGELAPRDVVAQVIDWEMKKRGIDHVNLDISHRDAEFVKSHFPTIYETCLEVGIDITRDPIPVVPAAHYTCGGVMTDLDGRTDVAQLYAVGETAFTGLHGANRMASNSLLECLVFATTAATAIATDDKVELAGDLPAWDASRVTESNEDVVVSHNWHELRQTMWNYVGIVRSNSRLNKALKRIDVQLDETNEHYSRYKVTPDLIELRNLAQVAKLIVLSAQQRKESRGLHMSQDYPMLLDEINDTVLCPST
jgi:L-aspartate oxidase